LPALLFVASCKPDVHAYKLLRSNCINNNALLWRFGVTTTDGILAQAMPDQTRGYWLGGAKIGCRVLAGDGLNEKTREEMVAAVEQAILSLGEPTYEEGMKKAVKLLEFVTDRVRSIQTPDEFRSVLDTCEQVSWKDEKLMLFTLQNLPSVVRVCLKMAAKSAAIDLPAPPGGRQPALTAQQSTEVVDYVWELSRKGATMDGAKLRASQKFGCSRRTIDRLCASRGSIPEDKPTMADAISLLTRGE